VRLLAEEIGRKQGVQMLVETRPGAASVIGIEAVARAKADGNTLLINANSFVIHPSLRKLSYYTMSGFEPIGLLAVTPMFIIVNRDAPYRTLLELLEAARREPAS
jgi:tripartite-type tricarboxylate transporter receptor subunit TctC